MTKSAQAERDAVLKHLGGWIERLEKEARAGGWATECDYAAKTLARIREEIERGTHFVSDDKENT